MVVLLAVGWPTRSRVSDPASNVPMVPASTKTSQPCSHEPLTVQVGLASVGLADLQMVTVVPRRTASERARLIELANSEVTAAARLFWIRSAKFGAAIAARMAIIETVIINSIKVNPLTEERAASTSDLWRMSGLLDRLAIVFMLTLCGSRWCFARVVDQWSKLEDEWKLLALLYLHMPDHRHTVSP